MAASLTLSAERILACESRLNAAIAAGDTASCERLLAELRIAVRAA